MIFTRHLAETACVHLSVWPQRGQIVVRERLLQRLSDCKKPVCWLAGPAGCGKTALLASWCYHAPRPLLYYPLEQSDNSIGVFLRRLGELTGSHLNSRQIEPRDFAAFYQHLAPNQLIVLDNYQQINNPEFHPLLIAAVEALPVGMLVLILSRHEPPAQLVRLRAYNLLQQIDCKELFFDPIESLQLLRLYSEESELRLQQIAQRAAGWATGLMLMQQQPEHYQRTLFDFFDSEIFQKCNLDTQQFLLTSCFKNNLKINPSPQFGKILRYLQQHHCFICRHPQQPDEFMFHPLFAEFLQTRARNTLSSRTLQRVLREQEAPDQQPIRIYLHKKLKIYVDGQMLQFANKPPKKALALLDAVIQAGGRDVCASTLADSLWPDSEGDAAHRSLKFTLHSLRKLLGYNDSLIYSNAALSLNHELCWVDVLSQQAPEVGHERVAL